MTALNRDDLDHLLRHAGFGEDEKLVERYWMKRFDTREEVIDAIVDFRPKAKAPKAKRRSEELMLGWLDDMAKSKNPLEHKLMLFWHSHFATQAEVIPLSALTYQWNVIHEHALGDFQQLVLAVAKTPATIRFLDNQSNVVGAPNENFAREVMELYTVGVHAAYPQSDVGEAARAFTGWRYEGSLNKKAGFFFQEGDHDTDAKTFGPLFGDQTIQNLGVGDGEWVIERLTEMRACAEFISAKLWDFFAYPLPDLDPQNPPAVVQDLAGVYLTSGRNIRAVLRALFRHPAFWSAQARRSRVKSPVELYVGIRRLLKPKINQKKMMNELAGMFGSMGQSLFNPPTVAGWDEYLSWITTASLVTRYRLANRITSGRKGDIKFDAVKRFKKFEPGPVARLSEAVADRILVILQLGEVPQSTRLLLADYLDTLDGNGPEEPGLVTPGSFDLEAEDKEIVDAKLRGAFYLALSLPDFQMA